VLLVGTNRILLDIDRSFTVAEDTSVTALAVSGATAFAMLDAERVDRIAEYDCQAVAGLPEASGQSMAVVVGGVASAGSPATGGAAHHPGSGHAPSPGGHLFGHHPEEQTPEALQVDLLVGLTAARLTVVTAGGAVRPISSFDSVPGRSGWGNPGGRSPDLRSVAVADDGQWLANVHVGGLWGSDDEGGSWTALIEPDADVHEVTTAAARLAVAAAGGAGWSDNRGHTWHWSTDGLEAPYARAVALDGETMYITASTGPSTTAGALYRATLGHRFEKCAGGLPEWFPFNIDTGSLAARAGRVAFGTNDGRVFESQDEGSSWNLVAEHLGAVRCVKLG
jgi:hypothetical protein